MKDDVVRKAFGTILEASERLGEGKGKGFSEFEQIMSLKKGLVQIGVTSRCSHRASHTFTSEDGQMKHHYRL